MAKAQTSAISSEAADAAGVEPVPAGNRGTIEADIPVPFEIAANGGSIGIQVGNDHRREDPGRHR
ncbi:MAG: hypothetical protein U0792_01235 [Gemmataceae bacterium]